MIHNLGLRTNFPSNSSDKILSEQQAALDIAEVRVEHLEQQLEAQA